MVEKRTVLITGCSDGGLGAALASAFHKAGWRVLASLRNPSKAKGLEAQGIELLQLDVLDQKSITKCADQVKTLTGGKLNMLIHNAGGGYSMPIVDLNIDELRKLFELNVFSIPTVTKAFLPLLIEAQGINVVHASVASIFTTALQGAYNASKAASASLGATLRNELAPFGVQSVVLQTGAIATNFWDNATTPSLPADSLYKAGGEKLESSIRGEPLAKISGNMDSWAATVVGDLSVARPAPYIYRGKYSTACRVVGHLPPMIMDYAASQDTGLDLVAADFKKQREAKKTV